MSKVNFQQDRARILTALETQNLLAEKFPHFWTKDIWPANRSDLSLFENLWSILGEKVKKMRSPLSTIASLGPAPKDAWKKIPSETLNNLSILMPDRNNVVKRVTENFL